MKIFLTIIISLSLALTNCYCQEVWTTVINKGAGVKAELFGEYKLSIDTLTADNEIIYCENYVGRPLAFGHPIINYEFRLSPYPSTYIHSDSSYSLIEGFLNSTVQHLIDDSKYEYVNSSLIFKNNYPGKEFKFKRIDNNELYESNALLYNNILIEFITRSSNGNWFSKSKSRMYESVTFVDSTLNAKDYGISIIIGDTYDINFPESPEVQNKFVDSDYGIVNNRLRILELDNSDSIMVLMSGETKFPDEFVIENSQLDSFYTESMSGSIKSMNGSLLSKEEFMLDDQYPGVEYLVSLFNGRIISKNRLILHNRRLYTLAVMYHPMVKNAGTSFLNSFTLIPIE